MIYLLWLETSLLPALSPTSNIKICFISGRNLMGKPLLMIRKSYSDLVPDPSIAIQILPYESICLIIVLSKDSIIIVIFQYF
jgi:hypothetical protein